MGGDKPGAAIAALAVLVATAAAAWWLNLSFSPNTGKNIYNTEATFKSYVASLGLANMALDAAKNRLMVEGFRCELFADGNVSCNRKVQGSKCGEQQFVDLAVSSNGGLTHSVSTRFGLVCR